MDHNIFGDYSKDKSDVQKEKMSPSIERDYLEELMKDMVEKNHKVLTMNKSRGSIYFEKRIYKKSDYFELEKEDKTPVTLHMLHRSYRASGSPTTHMVHEDLFAFSEIYMDSDMKRRTVDIYYENPGTHLFISGDVSNFFKDLEVAIQRRDLSELKDLEWSDYDA